MRVSNIDEINQDSPEWNIAICSPEDDHGRGYSRPQSSLQHIDTLGRKSPLKMVVDVAWFINRYYVSMLQ